MEFSILLEQGTFSIVKSFSSKNTQSYAHAFYLYDYLFQHKSKKTKENANIPDFFRSQTFQESFTMFQKFYTYWLKTIKKDPQVHPWAEVKQKRKTAHN